MEIKILYQTLENRENFDEILANGPFPCGWPNTWLGEGYYFWDSLICNAHWWGRYRFDESYIITQGICDFNSELCFDLYANFDHLMQFEEICNKISTIKPEEEPISVTAVIEFLKNNDNFPYQAIRANSAIQINEKSKKNKPFIFRIPFEIGKKNYLDTRPPVQLCLLNKESLNFRDYKIIYPEESSDFSYTL